MLMGDRKKAEELYGIEMGLPPEMRNRLHLNLGVIGGKTVIWTPQYIPDILIGTKFITITNNQLFRLVAGEIGPKQFVQQILKDWGKAELKSGIYLLNPLVRFVQGAVSGTDPLDGSPVYSRYNRSTLSALEQITWLGVYFNKTCNPLLSTYLTEYNKQHMTHQDAMVKSLERFGYFKTILGWKESGRKLIYSVPTGRENIILKKEGERNITRELAEETRMLMGKEQGLINDIKNDWIRSGLDPLDYAKSKDLESNLKKLYDKVYKNTMSPKQWESFSKRINNVFKDPESNIAWAENHLRHMDPKSKRYKDLENWKLSVQAHIIKKGKGVPITLRGEKDEIIKSIIDNPNDFGNRIDGSKKGYGWLGVLKRPDGKISTELSIGVTMDGKQIEIPSLVPTLTKKEIDFLLEGNKPSKEIIDKAIEHAKKRISQGKSPFKD